MKNRKVLQLTACLLVLALVAPVTFSDETQGDSSDTTSVFQEIAAWLHEHFSWLCAFLGCEELIPNGNHHDFIARFPQETVS